MQTFRRQKLKSLLNDLQTRQGRDHSQLIVVDHSRGRLMSGGLSHNFVPIVNNLITLEEQRDQFQFQAKEDQPPGGFPPPPPPYFEDLSDGGYKQGEKTIEIGDALVMMECVPSEGLEKS